MNALTILVQKPARREDDEPPYEPSPGDIFAAITGARPNFAPTDLLQSISGQAPRTAPSGHPPEDDVPEAADEVPADEIPALEYAADDRTEEPAKDAPYEEVAYVEEPRRAAPPLPRPPSRDRPERYGRDRAEARAEAPTRSRTADARSSAPQHAEEPNKPRSGKLPEAKIDPPEKFRELGVNDTGLAAMAALGFDAPTPIQALAIPLMLAGGDVVGLAQTGTGKTIAFGLPLAAAIDPMNPDLQALVLVPTRELARQVSETLEHLGLFHGFTVVTLMGGTRVAGDVQRLQRGAQVMVGTPGRVIDHIKRGNLSLHAIKFAILDEADEMLDIGFARDIDYILRSVPKDRQSALFSATMPESIRRLVWRYLRNSQEVSVEPERRTAENVTQQYCEVAVRDKAAALLHLHRTLDLGRSLIFRKMKIGVDRLTRQLQDNGAAARAIHGDLAQSERDAVLAGFKRGDIQFLVATNVAARGLDIPDVQHVINFDVPQNAEEYIHRIGRTARAGKKGSAITFVGEWEIQEWDRIRSEVGGVEMDRLELPRHL